MPADFCSYHGKIREGEIPRGNRGLLITKQAVIIPSKCIEIKMQLAIFICVSKVLMEN